MFVIVILKKINGYWCVVVIKGLYEMYSCEVYCIMRM